MMCTLGRREDLAEAAQHSDAALTPRDCQHEL
jgi:hypothetical protein